MNTTELIEAVKSAQEVNLVDPEGNEVPYTTFRELGLWLYEGLTKAQLGVTYVGDSMIVAKAAADSTEDVGPGWTTVDTSDLTTGPLANWSTLTDEQATEMLTKAEPEPREGTNQFNHMFNQLGLKYEDWYLDCCEDSVLHFCHETDSMPWIELDFNKGELCQGNDRDIVAKKTFTLTIH